ncbi:MAG: hypothetical protein FWF76_04415 [Oscillospiraceae bacterium]|nr:hypothetical protein [Oscillospiraceae bacterium]
MFQYFQIAFNNVLQCFKARLSGHTLVLLAFGNVHFEPSEYALTEHLVWLAPIQNETQITLTLLVIIAVLLVLIFISGFIVISEFHKKKRNRIDELIDDTKLNTDLENKRRFRKNLGLLTLAAPEVNKKIFMKAASNFMDIAKNTPDPIDKAYSLGWAGRCFEDCGDVTIAATCYAAAAAVEPSDTYSLERLGDFFWQIDVSEAISHYEKLIKYDPVLSRGYYKLAKLFSENGKNHESIKHYETAIKVNNGYVAPMAELTLEYAKIGNFTSALKFYHLAMASDVYEFEHLTESFEKELRKQSGENDKLIVEGANDT